MPGAGSGEPQELGSVPSALLGNSSAPQVGRSRLVRPSSLSDSEILFLGSLSEESLVPEFGVMVVKW